MTLDTTEREQVGSSTKISSEFTEQLVLENRVRARRMGRSIMGRWGASIPEDEFGSVCDLALCEAASRFRSDFGTEFPTYLFYFLKGALARAIDASKMRSVQISFEDRVESSAKKNAETRELSEHDGIGALENGCPERSAYLDELRVHCNRALLSLNHLERKVVLNVSLLELKVAHVARNMGYSRGYVSSVRKDALVKMRRELGHLKQAA